MWYTKGALISLSHGFVKYQSPYDLLGSFILTYSVNFVYTVFIIVVINHNDRLSHLDAEVVIWFSSAYKGTAESQSTAKKYT